ncbi:hypothetical protein EZS27_009358 [termite gut metagenome]|uniref:Uncharacterized protein n=1 Tax=termite gut metagenome TaxID=433724 RepID=A0A5J4SAH4_9ZZZZ
MKAIGNVEERIKEIQDYFIQKLINGEFEVNEEKCTEAVFHLIIDGKYKFAIWIGISIKYMRLHAPVDCPNFIELGDFTDEQKESLRAHIDAQISKNKERKKKVRIRQLQAELAGLQTSI